MKVTGEEADTYQCLLGGVITANIFVMEISLLIYSILILSFLLNESHSIFKITLKLGLLCEVHLLLSKFLDDACRLNDVF